MYGMAVDLHILAPVLKSLVSKWNNVPTTAFLKVDQNLMWEWGRYWYPRYCFSHTNPFYCSVLMKQVTRIMYRQVHKKRNVSATGWKHVTLHWIIVYTRSALFWGHYAASCGNRLLTFQDNVSWPMKMGPIRCPKTSVNNYHTTPHNVPKERRSHQHRGESLKSRYFVYVWQHNFINILTIFVQTQTKYVSYLKLF
jgi:hypothetical protein